MKTPWSSSAFAPARLPMNKILLWLSLALTMAAPLAARSKEFTILGREKIKAQVQDGMPLPAEKDGIRIEAAALGMSADGLQFGFMLTSGQALSSVVVEDVSGASAVVLVQDLAPTLNRKNLWLGRAKTLPLTPAGVPWLFARGDTTMVFRFTVGLAQTKRTVVLYQPAVYSAEAKQLLRSQAK